MSLHDLWPRYFGLGGSCSIDELLYYLHDLAVWPAQEHDAAAQALNEECQALGFGFPVLYADETVTPPIVQDAETPSPAVLAADSIAVRDIGSTAAERAPQTAAIRTRLHKTLQQSAELANAVARTADDIARTYDELLTNGRAATASRAERARRFAERHRGDGPQWGPRPT